MVRTEGYDHYSWKRFSVASLRYNPIGDARGKAIEIAALYPLTYTEVQVSLLQRTMEYGNATVLGLCC